MRNIPLFGSVLFFLGGIVLGYANQGMEGIAWILGLVCVSIHFQARNQMRYSYIVDYCNQLDKSIFLQMIDIAYILK